MTLDARLKVSTDTTDVISAFQFRKPIHLTEKVFRTRDQDDFGGDSEFYLANPDLSQVSQDLARRIPLAQFRDSAK